ncbi:MAG: transposase [Planctomycetota bacterium]|nr:transposase [Planctomycetota bacterium]
MIYHVLNRGNGRTRIFHKPEDYDAFLKLLGQAREFVPGVKLFGVCLMPNHWHLVLQPHSAKDLARFMRWLSTAHVRRHHAHHRSASGHLYQGRYKSFPVQDDHHFLTLMRYVEANPLRAKLSKSAGAWPWSSDAMARTKPGRLLLSDWPVDRPRNWNKLLAEAIPKSELEQLRTSVNRGRPYGSDPWTRLTAARLDLGSTLRPRGRPRAVMD